MADYETLALIDTGFAGLERAIMVAVGEIKDRGFADRLDVFLERLMQARAESGFPRLLDDARLAAGYEQCARCGETLTPERQSGVLDLCATCASERKWPPGEARGLTSIEATDQGLRVTTQRCAE